MFPSYKPPNLSSKPKSCLLRRVILSIEISFRHHKQLDSLHQGDYSRDEGPAEQQIEPPVAPLEVELVDAYATQK